MEAPLSHVREVQRATTAFQKQSPPPQIAFSESPESVAGAALGGLQPGGQRARPRRLDAVPTRTPPRRLRRRLGHLCHQRRISGALRTKVC